MSRALGATSMGSGYSAPRARLKQLLRNGRTDLPATPIAGQQAWSLADYRWYAPDRAVVRWQYLRALKGPSEHAGADSWSFRGMSGSTDHRLVAGS